MTTAFAIPQNGLYRIVLQGAFPGARASSQNATLESINVNCDPVTFQLEASTPVLTPRQSKDPLAGCSDQRHNLLQAINIAGFMAYDAFKNENLTLFEEYFGIDQHADENTFGSVLRTLLSSFYNANRYLYSLYNGVNDPTNAGITYNCDATSTTLPLCKIQGVRGFYQYSTNSINLCKPYFGGPAVLACQEPGIDSIAIQDQASTILHEVSHDNTLMPQKVKDWPDPFVQGRNCYNYKCAVSIAHDRNPSALPEASAINLQEYAQAIRHRLRGSSWGCINAWSDTPGLSPKPDNSATDADNTQDGECVGC